MTLASRSSVIGLALSIGVAIVAGGLTAWQLRDRRRRPSDLPPEDVRHYRRQDFRRLFGAGVMLLLAAGVAVGSRVPHLLANRANPLFVKLWLAVFALVLVLLGLALIDWIATRLFARRQRRALAREHVEMLQEELRRRSYPTNGKADSHDGAIL